MSATCPRCGAKLSSARICPLCGAGVGDEISDAVPQAQTRRVRYFPRWLYRAASWALGATGLLFLALFAGGALMWWVWLALVLLGALGLFLILVATFGPWPLEP